jgi:RNA processing factor Prp31
LAGKISIAARRDFFSKNAERIDSGLQSGLQERFEQLQKLPEKQKKKEEGKFSRENPMLPKKFTPRENSGRPFRQGFNRNSRLDFREFGSKKPFKKFRK